MVLVDELDALTNREREVLDLLAQGMTNKEIGEALVITTNTVKRHLKSIFEKLEVDTRSAATVRAISLRIVRTTCVAAQLSPPLSVLKRNWLP